MAVLQRPVNLRSWNTLVRLGLIHVISADIPVSQASVPETLLLDLERLFRLQNEFGRIIVLAACLLVLQQSSIPQGKWHASFRAPQSFLLCSVVICAAYCRRLGAVYWPLVNASLLLLLCTLMCPRTPQLLEHLKLFVQVEHQHLWTLQKCGSQVCWQTHPFACLD